MIPDSSRLLGDALKLPVRERARLASQLLASLDGEADEDVEAVWAAKLERRARRVLAGEGEFEDWDVVCAQLEPSIPSYNLIHRQC